MQDVPSDEDDWEGRSGKTRLMKPGRISFRGLSFTAERVGGRSRPCWRLATAVEALARLDARAGCASDRVAEGLRRRLALREAAGWLAHQGAWIPSDRSRPARGRADRVLHRGCHHRPGSDRRY